MGVCGCEVVGGAAVPKGPMTYAQSFGDLGLKTGIWVSRVEFGPKGY